EGDDFGRDELRRQDEVALIFAALIVCKDDHFARAEVVEDVRDRGQGHRASVGMGRGGSGAALRAGLERQGSGRATFLDECVDESAASAKLSEGRERGGGFTERDRLETRGVPRVVRVRSMAAARRRSLCSLRSVESGRVQRCGWCLSARYWR